MGDSLREKVLAVDRQTSQLIQRLPNQERKQTCSGKLVQQRTNGPRVRVGSLKGGSPLQERELKVSKNTANVLYFEEVRGCFKRSKIRPNAISEGCEGFWNREADPGLSNCFV